MSNPESPDDFPDLPVPQPLPDRTIEEDPDVVIRDLITTQAGQVFKALAHRLESHKNQPIRVLRLAESYSQHLREFLSEVAVPEPDDRLVDNPAGGMMDIAQARRDARRARAAGLAGQPGVPQMYGGAGAAHLPNAFGLQIAQAPPRQGFGTRDMTGTRDLVPGFERDETDRFEAERRELDTAPRTPPDPQDQALDQALARLDADQLPALLDALERANRLNDAAVIAYCKAQIAAIVGTPVVPAVDPVTDAAVPPRAEPETDPLLGSERPPRPPAIETTYAPVDENGDPIAPISSLLD